MYAHAAVIHLSQVRMRRFCLYTLCHREIFFQNQEADNSTIAGGGII